MSNKPTHFIMVALVSLLLASMACNLLTIKPRTMSPLTSQSASCAGVPNPSTAPSQNFSDRLNAVQGEVHQASVLMQQQQFAAAVLCWDDVLVRVPEYAD